MQSRRLLGRTVFIYTKTALALSHTNGYLQERLLKFGSCAADTIGKITESLAFLHRGNDRYSNQAGWSSRAAITRTPRSWLDKGRCPLGALRLQVNSWG